MKYEVVYQDHGDMYPRRFALATNDKATAYIYCQRLMGPLPNAVHYVITSEDGETLHDTRVHGLIR